MTLSTRAEHENGREIEHVRGEVSFDISPAGRVETALLELENADGVTEASPAAVNKQSVSRAAADDLRPIVTDAAMPFTDSRYIAERAARDLCEQIPETVDEMVAASPYLVSAHESDADASDVVDTVEVDK